MRESKGTQGLAWARRILAWEPRNQATVNVRTVEEAASEG